MRRVVVTGIGLLSSIGVGKENTWTNLLNGKSGIKKSIILTQMNLLAKLLAIFRMIKVMKIILIFHLI